MRVAACFTLFNSCTATSYMYRVTLSSILPLFPYSGTQGERTCTQYAHCNISRLEFNKQYNMGPPDLWLTHVFLLFYFSETFCHPTWFQIPVVLHQLAQYGCVHPLVSRRSPPLNYSKIEMTQEEDRKSIWG